MATDTTYVGLGFVRWRPGCASAEHDGLGARRGGPLIGADVMDAAVGGDPSRGRASGGNRHVKSDTIG